MLYQNTAAFLTFRTQVLSNDYNLFNTMKVSILLIIAAIVYIISAWYNIGYYHADEHYQLIEFSGLKLGWNNKNNLAWEFHSMIRPSFQVWVCYLLFGFFNILGISDPYILSFILRLVTAFLAIVGIYVFSHVS